MTDKPRYPFQGNTRPEDYELRVHMLRQIAWELDQEAEQNGVKPPCSEASVLREAADEIEARRLLDFPIGANTPRKGRDVSQH